jgi:hypothetical protein
MTRRRYNPRHTRVYREARADFLRVTPPVCWWCGEPIDMRLSGRHPDGPTVDHLEPVDDAPEKFWDRSLWRLAHRRCNDKRGASGAMPPPHRNGDQVVHVALEGLEPEWKWWRGPDGQPWRKWVSPEGRRWTRDWTGTGVWVGDGPPPPDPGSPPLVG